MGIVGKPVLIERLDAELGPRVVELIAEDNKRALKERRRRTKKRRERKKKRGGRTDWPRD